ncbi:hypothetical protein N8I74_04890 [Chitiniphilus purpureus]|uniref:Uncharacterized protein n=1 Tax=Chitiniphilus purpureus TaxID=2981137 RepID=A0ABY6DPQ0_9NEIS|nr:hypothetical protein [Chitiniphilus sp. CD1]UXY16359.1 hypothetical protein N8I74_04890 [Chitiniphilus sp. CD1]
MADPDTAFRHSHGFTLLDPTMLLTVVAITTATLAVFPDRPIRGDLANRQRNDLPGPADAAMRQLTKPNSIRLARGGARQALPARRRRGHINHAPSPSLARQRNRVACVQLALTRANETVSLHQVIHVANLP